jgi:hypothetical protein
MVDAVKLDDVTGKHVDAILDFLACSDLRLAGLSATKRKQRIEEIIREEYPELPWRVAADCRTFKELQVCARLWRKVRDAKLRPPEVSLLRST